MTYSLEFKKSALKEWKKLSVLIKQQFKKKLMERLGNPHVPSAKLSGVPNCYKIKLRQSGYRLIYQVNDHTVVVTVIAVGKREGGRAYFKALTRL